MSNRTEALKDWIRLVPDGELGVDDGGELVKRAEKAVMEPEAAKQFPDALDGVEFRAVGRQEQQDKIGLVDESPLPVQVGVMVFGVVDDDNHASAATTGDAPQLAQEVPASPGIKGTFGLRGAQLAIPEPDGAKVADRFSGGGVPANRIFDLRGHPHTAAAPVLLEMDLIHRPQIDGGIECERVQFFLLPPAGAGRRELPSDGVCATGSPTGERVAGSCARTSSRRTAAAGKSTTAGHCTTAPASRSRLGLRRSAVSIRLRSFGFKRDGRPSRKPSLKPANPRASNRCTQYSTVRGASPNTSAT